MNAPFEEFQEDLTQAERWLAGHPTEGPSERAIASTRAAVRAELARSHRPVGFTWRPWHGTVGAVATIAACLVFAWSGLTEPQPSLDTAPSLAGIALPAELQQQGIELAELDEGLADLEALSPTLLEPGELSLYNAWEEALSIESNDEGGEPSTRRPAAQDLAESRLG